MNPIVLAIFALLSFVMAFLLETESFRASLLGAFVILAAMFVATTYENHSK